MLAKDYSFYELISKVLPYGPPLKYRHLIPALNAWAARAQYTTACLIATKFPGHGCIFVIDVLVLFFQHVIHGCFL